MFTLSCGTNQASDRLEGELGPVKIAGVGSACGHSSKGRADRSPGSPPLRWRSCGGRHRSPRYRGSSAPHDVDEIVLSPLTLEIGLDSRLGGLTDIDQRFAFQHCRWQKINTRHSCATRHDACGLH
jgi:hypothetical protein